MYVYAIDRFAEPLTRERALAAIARTVSEFALHKVLEEHKASRSHWHFKRAAGSGTLEATWFGKKDSIRVIVHKNRVGADGWAKNFAPTFSQTLASILGGHVTPQHVTNGH